MRAEGKSGGERQTCFTCSAPNLPVDISTGGGARCRSIGPIEHVIRGLFIIINII